MVHATKNAALDALAARAAKVGAAADAYAEAATKHAQARNRLNRAENALAETEAELHREGAVQGKNAEERSACLFRLTAAERQIILENREAVVIAAADLEAADARFKADRLLMQGQTAVVQLLATGGE